MKKKLFIVLSTIILTLSACGSDSKEKTGVDSGFENGNQTNENANNNQNTQKEITFTISYELDGGVNASANPSSYVAGSTLSFANPSKTGYDFLGWFDNGGNQITGITPDTTGNLSLIAHWTASMNNLSVTSEDASKGTATIALGSGYSDESITVVAKPAPGHRFDGWYNGNTKVSGDVTYTFTMPKDNYSLVARFIFDETLATRLGIIPVKSQDGKTIQYGLYPQKNVNNASTLSALNKLSAPQSNGWYLYNDEYYAKVSATPRNTYYKFDNGSTIVNGTTYWFKCEPITWNVLSNNYGNYYLLSSILLDAHCYYRSQDVRIIQNYYVYPNDYEDSDIRSWLNNEFYNSAFGFNSAYILTTNVDNSAETTHSPDNHYWCNDTQDSVFLPSYQDYMNTSYGFENNADSSDLRKCKTIDWCRARGIYYSNKINQYYSPYWTRSPYRFYNDIYSAADIDSYGRLAASDVSFTGDGVRPAITLKIS